MENSLQRGKRTERWIPLTIVREYFVGIVWDYRCLKTDERFARAGNEAELLEEIFLR